MHVGRVYTESTTDKEPRVTMHACMRGWLVGRLVGAMAAFPRVREGRGTLSLVVGTLEYVP